MVTGVFSRCDFPKCKKKGEVRTQPAQFDPVILHLYPETEYLLCRMHYQRLTRYGDPSFTKRQYVVPWNKRSRRARRPGKGRS